jgi:hypothetical protein
MIETTPGDIVPPAGKRVLDPWDLPSVVRDAHIFGSVYGGDEENLVRALRGVLGSLAEGKIPHVLVGGLALLQHVEGRNTRDVDLILAPGDARKISGFVEEERNEWFSTGHVGPLRVDLLFTTNPLFALVLANYSSEKDFHGQFVRIATPFGMVLLKMFALPSLYRQGEISRAKIYESDIQALCLKHPIDEENALRILSGQMSSSDVNALRGVMSDIRESINHNPFQ